MADIKEIVIYVHGKGGSAAEAGHYRPLFPDAEVVGFDYRAQSPWEAEAEFPPFFAAQAVRETAVSTASSIAIHFFIRKILLENVLRGHPRCLYRRSAAAAVAADL